MPSPTIDTTVNINAGKDAVWDVLTDFASYNEWNPVMRIEGAPEVHTTLVVQLTGAGFRAASALLPRVARLVAAAPRCPPGHESRTIGRRGGYSRAAAARLKR